MTDHQDTDFADIVRPEINGLPDYNAGLARDRFKARYGVECRAKLDSNENPLGPSPRAVAAIMAGAENVGFYPDAATLTLRQAIGEGLALPPQHVVTGNGSEDLIGAVFRAVLRPGDHVVTICPSFGLHEFGALACGATVAKYAFGDDWSFPVDDMIKAIADRPRVLIFSSPSNPAGPAISEADFDRIMAALDADTLFVFDEAYVEYLSPEARFDALGRLKASGLPWISLRTFSKAYGLAGIRVGYALCANELLAKALMKTRNPFGVNALAAVAALEAFADTDHVNRSVAATVSERENLRAALTARGFHAAPAHTNFLFFKCEEPGAAFAEKLRHEGVLIKGWLEIPYRDWARVTIGTPDQNAAFLDAIDSIRSGEKT